MSVDVVSPEESIVRDAKALKDGIRRLSDPAFVAMDTSIDQAVDNMVVHAGATRRASASEC